MNVIIMDCEGDSLYPSIFHCMSYCGSKDISTLKTVTSYSDMKEVLLSADIIIGHNIIRWDIPQLERVLQINITAALVDTLPLSWFLYREKKRHGLEAWGEFFGVPKPVIDDWENLTIEEYSHRCEEDVKINQKLWAKFAYELNEVYGGDWDEAMRFIKYLMFKTKCAMLQEKSKWRLDVEAAKKYREELLAIVEHSKEELEKVLPDVPKIATRHKPKQMVKKNGEPTTYALTWFENLEALGLPADHEEPIKVVYRYDPPKATSPHQIKNWLFKYNWEPETFKRERNDDGTYRKIPQIRTEKKELCRSVKKLINVLPEIKYLEGFTVAKHRSDVLKNFLIMSDENDGYVIAGVSSFTNTLRFNHKGLVNLPGIKKQYGKYVRGVLIAPEGYELCGSDMSSLEDRLKQHYIQPYDPNYVKTMMTDNFDPHLDLAKTAKALTDEDIELFHKVKRYHKEEKDVPSVAEERFKEINNIRDIYKSTNYAAQYGSGAATLAFTAKVSENEAKKVLTIYKRRNWAIQRVANNQVTKDAVGKTWLLNPISGFWYELKAKKDVFSTLVQGSGVYCFDVWIKNFLKVREQLTGQFHDEVILTIRKGNREVCEKVLRDAIKKTNEQLTLNRDLDIDVQFGDKYSEIH